MKRKRTKRVRETFKASVWCVSNAGEVYAYLDVNSPRLKKQDWIDGDQARVTVERLPQKVKNG